MPGSKDTPTFRPSRSLIAAVGFLVISLIAAGLIVARTLSAEAVPEPTDQLPTITAEPTDETPPTDEPTTQPVEASLTPTEEVSMPGLPTIGLAGLSADPALGEQLRQALEQSLETSVPTAIVEAELPPDYDLAAALETSEYELLVVWESREDGLVSLFILAPSQPPLSQLEELPAVWAAHAPGSFPVYVDSASDLSALAELVASTYDLLNGDSDQALGRLFNLQARSTAPIEAIRVNNEAVIQFTLGQVYAEQDQPVEALKAYSQAIRLHNDFAAAHIGRGNVYLALGDENTAYENYNAALANNPNDVAALYNRAIASWQAGSLDGALQDSMRINELYPNSVWGLNLRGCVHYQLGDYEDAQTDFAHAHEVAPDLPIPLFNQALALYQLGDYETSLELVAAAVEKDDGDPVLHYWQGATYQALGEAELADSAYGRAVRLNPDYVDAYLGRASLSLDIGAYDQAIADAEQALSIDPGSGAAYQIIGTALLLQDDFEEAERAYTAAIELGLEDVEVYAGRAWARQMQGISLTAASDYDQAVALDADDPLMFYHMGFALYDTFQFEEALAAFEKAIAGGIDGPEAQIALAVALDANFEREEAEVTLQEALEAEPRYEDLNLLADLPPWSDNAIQRAKTILDRIEGDSEDGSEGE